MIKVGIGQDSHRLVSAAPNKPLILGGVEFNDKLSIEANSDGDVVLHAITNAISGITGVPILGAAADKLCKQGITDSKEYLKLALVDLQNREYSISHLSISIEALLPKFMSKMEELKVSIAQLLDIKTHDIGITATTGEGLTEFGKGNGIQVLCIITCVKSI